MATSCKWAMWIEMGTSLQHSAFSLQPCLLAVGTVRVEKPRTGVMVEGHLKSDYSDHRPPLGPVDPNRYCTSSLLGVPLRHEFTRLQPAKVSPNNVHSHRGSA